LLGLVALLEESASVPASVESSQDLGSSEGTVPGASSELVQSSSVNSASLALSDVSFDNSGSFEDESGSWTEHSSHSADLSLTLLVLLEGAGSSSASPGSDGSPAHVPADGSLLSSSSVDSASSST